MKALKQRDSAAGLALHEKSEARIYYVDKGVHKERIERTWKMIRKCIPDRRRERIVELGCGTGDIIGAFCGRNLVTGFDCNAEALKMAQSRFPSLSVGPIPEEPVKANILILCEFLEHLADPVALVKAWLPLAEQVVISHPFNGDIKGDLSGGEHQWSYDAADFENWFAVGGHKLVESEVFKMEGYDIILGRGKRIDPCIYAIGGTK